MTSAFAQDGFCTTISGASTPLQTPYSVSKPSSVTADPAGYQSAAATRFVNFLSVPDWGICGEDRSLAVHLATAGTTAVVNVAVTTTLGVEASTSLASPSNTAGLAATQSSLSKPASTTLSTRAKAAIGIAVSVVVLAMIIPGLLLWYRYRKQRAAMIEKKLREKLEPESETETGFP